jgi:predicted ribosome quality control (RQC) complex YloA/Tae2 family protein
MNFRTHLSKQGTVFFAGRNDQTNEELVSEAKPEEYVFHTRAPGSPFVLIKGIPKHGDLKEAALVCARYSRDWKKTQDDITIHQFLGKNIHKTKEMKTGTFGVKNAKVIKVKKNDIINFNSNPIQKGRLKELE